MSKYIIRRLLLLILILLGVSIIVFMLVHLAPGDPIRILLGEQATPTEVERLRSVYGLDRPLPVQYFSWLGNALQGDLGTSLRQGRPVTELLFDRFGATIELAFAGILISLILAIPLGILAAVKQSTWIDFSTMIFALLGVSMPGFWVGLMLLTHVALPIEYFPLFGRDASLFNGIIGIFTTGSFATINDAIRYLILPAFSLGILQTSLLTRLTRSSMLEVLKADYIRTARSKGLSEKFVIFKHALRNALLPVVTVLGIRLGALLGGSVIIETVFAWPGVGRLIYNSISQRDFPIVQAGTLMLAVAFSMANLLVDISYAYLNPKIRYD